MVTAPDATLLSLAAGGRVPAFGAHALAGALQADLRLLVAADTALPTRLRIVADDGRQATGQLLAVGFPEAAHVAVDIGATAGGWEVAGVWDLLAQHDGHPNPLLLWGWPAPTWLCEPSPSLTRRLEAGGADPATFGGAGR
jgi:hypothetical protein